MSTRVYSKHITVLWRFATWNVTRFKLSEILHFVYEDYTISRLETQKRFVIFLLHDIVITLTCYIIIAVSQVFTLRINCCEDYRRIIILKTSNRYTDFVKVA